MAPKLFNSDRSVLTVLKTSIQRVSYDINLTAEQHSHFFIYFSPQCGSAEDPECDNRVVLTPAVTDYVFFCPQRLALFNGTTSDQWLYYFNQTWSFKVRKYVHHDVI